MNDLALIIGGCGSGKTTIAFSMLQKEKRTLYLSRMDEMKIKGGNITFKKIESDDVEADLIKKYIDDQRFDLILIDGADELIQSFFDGDIERLSKTAKAFQKKMIITSKISPKQQPFGSKVSVFYY